MFYAIVFDRNQRHRFDFFCMRYGVQTLQQRHTHKKKEGRQPSFISSVNALFLGGRLVVFRAAFGFDAGRRHVVLHGNAVALLDILVTFG